MSYVNQVVMHFNLKVMLIIIFYIISEHGNTTFAQQRSPSLQKDLIRKVKIAIQAKSTNYDVHEEYYKSVKWDTNIVFRQYDALIKEFPKSSMLPLL